MFCISLLVVTNGQHSLAQVSTTISSTPAGVGGLHTVVTPSSVPENICGANCVITGGTRPGGGVNLFHSFGQFNIGAGDIATFQNGISFDINGNALAAGLPTSNILARVTGTSGNNPTLSSIYGTIQTSGFGNANLFLMNPAGFLFGPNATINVGGMVAFTSADYLRLEGTEGNGLFHADTTQLSVLTSAPVVAFGFLGSNPGAITVQGSQFTVTEGNGINLVGGNITVQSGLPDDGLAVQPALLNAPGGQINLASAASPGEILTNMQSAPNINGQTFTAMGNINLSEGSLVDVSDIAAGTVRIRGGELFIDQATISADTADADAPPVAIDINVTGAMSVTNTSLSAMTARTIGVGNAGDIVISSGSLNATFGTDVFDVALIDSHTMGSGHGGNVTITTGALSATGTLPEGGFFVNSGTAADGNGGNVTITAGDAHFTRMSIDTGLNIYFGSGSGGNLKVNAKSLIIDTALWGTDSMSGAGEIHLETSGLLQAKGNSFISSQGFFGNNPITIKAGRFVLENTTRILAATVEDGGDVSVTSAIVEFLNGGSIGTQTFGDGHAGNMFITASERISFIDDSGSLTPSGLYTTSLGGVGSLGAAGNITINTPQLELINGARINASTFTSGQGGNVTISGADSILITGERPPGPPFEDLLKGGTRASGIYTSSLGSELCTGSCGNAGSITIGTRSLALQNGGQINNNTTNSGQGGNVTVTASGEARLSGTMLDGTPGGIFSQTTETDAGAGSGGNILLKAASVLIQDGARLSANSLGAGTAGTVTVEGMASSAHSVSIDGQGSGILTDTQSTGSGGSIFVDATTVTMTNGASITASSTGPGNTGNIQINAGNQFWMTNSTVTTEANQSGGGAIKITTNPDGTVQLNDSVISASVLDGTGGGGSVDIDPQFVILQNSQILANAVFGPGGNINITTNLLLPDSASVISASSQFGQQGNIVIQSPVSPASGKLVPLGQKPLIATSLLSQRCAALAGGGISSFTVAGRDSLPAEPGGWVSSPLALSISESENGPVREADGMMSDETPLLSVRKIAPSGFLTQAFGMDASGCQS
jgi:filamentous hemagglutinin family protein